MITAINDQTRISRTRNAAHFKSIPNETKFRNVYLEDDEIDIKTEDAIDNTIRHNQERAIQHQPPNQNIHPSPPRRNPPRERRPVQFWRYQMV